MTNGQLFTASDLTLLFTKYWKHLVIVLVTTLVLTYIFTSPRFINPVYKSFAVVYPVNISPYSTETPTEQLYQMLLSDDLKDSLITRFDLVKHYKIDRDQPFFYTKTLKKLDENLSITSTRFESVKIVVYDYDPEIACRMVNEIFDLLNIKIRAIYRKQFYEVFDIVKTQMDLKKAELDSLDARLKEITVNYELFDVPAQANEVVRGYLGTVDGSNGQMVNHKNVLKFMENLINYGAEHIRTSGYAYTSRNEYLTLKNQLENVQKEVTKVLTYINIVTHPRVAEFPDFPVRWLIMLVCTASVFITTLLIIISFEKKKN
jgi:capsular polysaccharide biosynthesis protein